MNRRDSANGKRSKLKKDANKTRGICFPVKYSIFPSIIHRRSKLPLHRCTYETCKALVTAVRSRAYESRISVANTFTAFCFTIQEHLPLPLIYMKTPVMNHR